MACRTCDMIRGLLMSQGLPQIAIDAAVGAIEAVEPAVEVAVKRKVGKYQKRWGKVMEDLVKKHPRTVRATLMKRAHRIVRKEMKS